MTNGDNRTKIPCPYQVFRYTKDPCPTKCCYAVARDSLYNRIALFSYKGRSPLPLAIASPEQEWKLEVYIPRHAKPVPLASLTMTEVNTTVSVVWWFPASGETNVKFCWIVRQIRTGRTANEPSTWVHTVAINYLAYIPIMCWSYQNLLTETKTPARMLPSII